MLPDEFAPLNEEGNGLIVIRYGGWRIPVTVRRRFLRRGWSLFTRRARLGRAATLLVSHSVGPTVSILKFVRSMGLSSLWYLSAAPFDGTHELLEHNHFREGAITETVRTSYFPRSTSLFFSKASGVCTYEERNHQSMVN